MKYNMNNWYVFDITLLVNVGIDQGEPRLMELREAKLMHGLLTSQNKLTIIMDLICKTHFLQNSKQK